MKKVLVLATAALLTTGMAFAHGKECGKGKECCKKEEKKEDLVDEQTLQLRKVLKTPLEDLDLSVRAFNCLKAAKINSLSQLVQYEQEDLMKFRNFGQKSLSEIEQVLQERGLHFGMDLAKLGIDVEEY